MSEETTNNVLVIASKVKAYIQSLEPTMRVAGDFAEALTEQVKYLVQRAVGRAKANGRGTVQAKDV
jgi:histone H3/H4